MKKILILFLVVFIVSTGVITSCKKDNTIAAPDSQPTISFAVPPGWPQPSYAFTNNTLTQNGFVLGRKLFYDVRLSRDNTISCASCHAQFAAFSHLDHALSHGIDGLFGTRNAPGVFNMAWKPAYFWDGGVINLEQQPMNPIENPVEMDEKIADVVTELSGDQAYKALFSSAFGDEAISSQRIFKALAQFMGAMVSSDSRYDKYTRGEAGAALSDQELRGLSVFRDKCATCHAEPLFTDYSYRNNGLSFNSALNDSGRAHITNNPSDKYRFMVPSLRNVDLTRPYMHDGRFNTLEAVVEHYRTGINATLNLDPLLMGGIEMTDENKADVIAFLKTLTDTTFTKDLRFKDPG
jgi:cytochrome c peroxidase